MQETKELERLIACAELRNPNQYNADRERYLAGISFKAGRDDGVKFCHKQFDGNLPEIMELSEQQGRQEVVEWIHKEFGGYIPDSKGGLILKNILIDEEYGEDGSMDKWQAQLKVWGIK